ncbi:replicative DNA helicase [Streptantibioticus ferralitis]|uniref:Replicative DNA helicase n=1 Tax=Streptantibioticus ferralitis TaxID=236510 RepID=A0ABT5ZBA2_9ACTN|nr:replicative DNA helicase [Streptantibioticus ferralitis]MDF2260912.1 replicative DNA helicase [Streptantibioticus ferralitis]
MSTTVPTPTPPFDGEEPKGPATFQRIPPQDLDAEQSVLGGMLLSKDVIGDVVEVLQSSDFYRPAHETIFDTILDLYAQGEPADPITAAAELTKRGQINRVGGAAYLHTLVNAVPTAANAEYYAEIVADRAKLRRLVEAGTRITQMGYAADGEVSEILDAAGAELHNAIQLREDSATVRVGDRYADYIDRLEYLQKHGAAKGVPTGLSDLDTLTNGLHPGQMIVVAARPAMGKSTLALDFARACAIKHDRPAAVFSLEMGEAELMNRLTSAEARVGLHHLTSGNPSPDDWQRIAKVTHRIADAPLYLDTTANTTVMEIKAKCRRLQQRSGLDLVVIDYLQLMTTGRKTENRQVEVSEMSRSLKLLAKELNVPVVVLSQLNRGPEQRADKRPMLSDLRESGSIEQDADLVILLHREDAYDKESARSGEADLIVAKHRNGPTTTITAAALLHYSMFADMAMTA